MTTIPATAIYPCNRFAPHAAYEPIEGGWVLWYSRTEKNALGQSVTVWRRSKLVIYDEEQPQ